jgi:hypothetical protein
VVPELYYILRSGFVGLLGISNNYLKQETVFPGIRASAMAGFEFTNHSIPFK